QAVAVCVCALAGAVHAQPNERLTLYGHGDVVSAVAYAPDGKTIATVGKDKSLRVWNPVQGQPTTGQQLWWAQNNDVITTVAFSPDGKFLATGSVDKTIKIWAADNK